MIGICRICGESKDGMDFQDWVKDTFTNFDLLHPGSIICAGCLFWFEQRSAELQARMGKDKPQRMQNYSHFIVSGEWTPLSKSDKPTMRALLLDGPFPELAAIADSGQKHISFRARRNPPGSKAGWVQLEEQALWVEPSELSALLDTVEALYAVFSKVEIESGKYPGWRILRFGLGLGRFQELESEIRQWRGKPLFQLAIYLAQRKETNGDNTTGRTETENCRSPDCRLAGDTGGLQEPLPDEHLGTVREPGAERGLHIKPGEVHQLSLFEIGGRDQGGSENC